MTILSWAKQYSELPCINRVRFSALAEKCTEIVQMENFAPSWRRGAARIWRGYFAIRLGKTNIIPIAAGVRSHCSVERRRLRDKATAAAGLDAVFPTPVFTHGMEHAYRSKDLAGRLPVALPLWLARPQGRA